MDLRRLRDYTLNPHHPKGADKAYVFSSVLGIEMDHAEQLRDIILDGLTRHEARVTRDNMDGTRYVVDMAVPGLRPGGFLRTVWLIDKERIAPRLLTCFIR